MNVLEYFRDEHAVIEKELDSLLQHYSGWTREQVFDEVKLLCDAINGHLKKEEELLLLNIADNSALQEELNTSKADRVRVKDEIGQLISVHVDEPGFPEFLRNLQEKFTEHSKFCEALCNSIETHAKKSELAHIDSQLQHILVSAAGYNNLSAG
jgi:hypothetical protein